MKSLHYIATVVNSYRQIIDQYYNNEPLDLNRLSSDLAKAANRPTDTAWFEPCPGTDKMLYHDEEKKVTQNYAFIVQKPQVDGFYQVVTKNKICVGDEIEIIGPKLNRPVKAKIIGMKNLDLLNIQVCCTPMSNIYLKFDNNLQELNYPDIGRII